MQCHIQQTNNMQRKSAHMNDNDTTLITPDAMQPAAQLPEVLHPLCIALSAGCYTASSATSGGAQSATHCPNGVR